MNSLATMRLVRLAWAAVMALSLAACGDVGPAQTYRLVDLGSLDCHAVDGCYVGHVNDWCEVAGWDVLTNGDVNAYVWRPAATGSPTKTLLPTPNYRYSGPPMAWVPVQAPHSTAFRAYDINNFGEVIGSGSGPRNEAILWITRMSTTRSARTAYLGELPGGGAVSNGYSINDEAQISGSSDSMMGKHAIFFTQYDGMVDLKDLSHSTGTDYAEATGISEGGHVVGTGKAATGNHAFYWFQLPANAALFDLKTFNTGGADASSATAVNRWAVVVGQSGVPNGSHAFVWDATAGIWDLGDLPGGAEASVAYAIRDALKLNSNEPERGDIVGSGTIAAGPGVVAGGRRAVAWPAPAAAGMPYGAPIDLNTRLSPPDPSVTLVEARGINRFGVISAKGVKGGINHVYLLVPADADISKRGVTAYQQFCLGALP